jgi:hypothetical protein
LNIVFSKRTDPKPPGPKIWAETARQVESGGGETCCEEALKQAKNRIIRSKKLLIGFNLIHFKG